MRKGEDSGGGLILLNNTFFKNLNNSLCQKVNVILFANRAMTATKVNTDSYLVTM